MSSLGQNTKFVGLVLPLLLALILAGCGGGDDGSGGAEPAPAPNNRPAVPTMPAARFDQPTAAVDLSAASAADKEADTSGPDVATGEFIYSNRCAECHGERASGGEAGSLVGVTLSEAEFTDLIRTGGELGNEHLFGPTKISPEGLSSVYAYLTSLE